MKCCYVVDWHWKLITPVGKSTVKVNITVLLPEQQLCNETTCQSTCYISLTDGILHSELTPQPHSKDAFHVNAKNCGVCSNRLRLLGASCTSPKSYGKRRMLDNALHDKNRETISLFVKRQGQICFPSACRQSWYSSLLNKHFVKDKLLCQDALFLHS